MAKEILYELPSKGKLSELLLKTPDLFLVATLYATEDMYDREKIARETRLNIAFDSRKDLKDSVLLRGVPDLPFNKYDRQQPYNIENQVDKQSPRFLDIDSGKWPSSLHVHSGSFEARQITRRYLHRGYKGVMSIGSHTKAVVDISHYEEIMKLHLSDDFIDSPLRSTVDGLKIKMLKAPDTTAAR